MADAKATAAAPPLQLPWMAACLALLILGGSDPVTVAAGDEGVAVCVVAPRIEPLDGVDAYGIVLTPEPMLVVVEPLLELQIQRQELAPWQRRGSRRQPILTPLAWPAEPIEPNEPVLLQLQPLGAGRQAFAHVQLVGASSERMAQTVRLLETLGNNPDTWQAAFEQALERGDVPLAWTVLFDRRSPPSPELNELRRLVFERGCGD